MGANLGPSVRGMLAAGVVTAQVGPVFQLNRGFSAVARNGAGDYTVTLPAGQGVDLTQGFPQATVVGATTAEIAVEVVDALNYRVRTLSNAGAAVEVNFSLAIWDLGPT